MSVNVDRNIQRYLADVTFCYIITGFASDIMILF